jgi:hypothetical protein
MTTLAVKSINSLLCQGSTCFRWARSFAGAITRRGASTESPRTEPSGNGSCNMQDTRNTTSNKQMSIDNGLVAAQKLWTQTTQSPRTRGLDFSSPGRLSWSYLWVWRVFQKAVSDVGVSTRGKRFRQSGGSFDVRRTRTTYQHDPLGSAEVPQFLADSFKGSTISLSRFLGIQKPIATSP